MVGPVQQRIENDGGKYLPAYIEGDGRKRYAAAEFAISMAKLCENWRIHNP